MQLRATEHRGVTAVQERRLPGVRLIFRISFETLILEDPLGSGCLEGG